MNCTTIIVCLRAGQKRRADVSLHNTIGVNGTETYDEAERLIFSDLMYCAPSSVNGRTRDDQLLMVDPFIALDEAL